MLNGILLSQYILWVLIVTPSAHGECTGGFFSLHALWNCLVCLWIQFILHYSLQFKVWIEFLEDTLKQSNSNYKQENKCAVLSFIVHHIIMGRVDITSGNNFLLEVFIIIWSWIYFVTLNCKRERRRCISNVCIKQCTI